MVYLTQTNFCYFMVNKIRKPIELLSKIEEIIVNLFETKTTWEEAIQTPNKTK